MTVTRPLRLWRRAFGLGAGDRRDPLGPAGERLAARRLRREGFRVLERNVRAPMGEIDIVALAPDRRTIVFVEVKTRRVGAQRVERGERSPEAAVGARKQAKLRMLAQSIAHRRGWGDRPLRIDVVAVEWPERGRPTVRRHENAVTG